MRHNSALTNIDTGLYVVMALYEIPQSVIDRLDEEFKDETKLKLGTMLSSIIALLNNVEDTSGLVLTGLTNAANDAAAEAADVPVGGMYRNGSVLMVRVE